MSFDLETARATYSAGCAEDAANLVPDLIAEIERLRLLATFPKSESGLITGLCMAIRKTEEQAAEIERLRAELKEMAMKKLTEDQREALEQAVHICHEVTAFDVAKVLRAMLEADE